MNSKRKGKRGELEWASFLRDLGFDARRGQQFSGSPDSPDVVGGIPGTHAEVKRTERLRLREAMEQAGDDAGDSIPYVASRGNRGPWLVTVRAFDLVAFAKSIVDPPSRILVTCDVCGKEFQANRLTRITCSGACRQRKHYRKSKEDSDGG